MQLNDFTAKKRELDAHVEFLQEQLLLVEDRKERERLYSVLDELLAEKMQIDDYMEREAPVSKPPVCMKKKGVPIVGPVVKTREIPMDQPKMYEGNWGERLYDSKPEKSLSCGRDYPEIRDLQMAKLCEMEKGKVVRMCAPDWCYKIAYRWCIYYGRNMKGQYVLSDEERKVHRIEPSWGNSLFVYMDKTSFWKERTVFILDDLEGEEPRLAPVLSKDKLTNIGKGKLVQLWEEDWAIYQGKRDEYHIFVDEKGEERRLDLSFSSVEFYYKDAQKPVEKGNGLPPVDKLDNMTRDQIISLHPSFYHPEIGNRWCNYYGKNKKGEYVVSEADTTIKRIDSSWADKPFYYMDKPEFWKQRMVPIPDEMDELQKVRRVFKYPPHENREYVGMSYSEDNMCSAQATNVPVKKDNYIYLGRDEQGEAILEKVNSFSSLHEDYKKMLDEMCDAQAMTVSEKSIPRRKDKGKEKVDEERICLPEEVCLLEAHRKKQEEMWRKEKMAYPEDWDEQTIPENVDMQKMEKSLAALHQVGKAPSDKFASRSKKVFTSTGYALALLEEIEVGSQVRLVGPPRVSVENFWSTYLGVDEQGYPVLQDEKKKHRINKDYLKKQWACKEEGKIEDRSVELREACALGQVEKVAKLLQSEFMLHSSHLCMAVQSGNLEILKLLHQQTCSYDKHTLSDFCGRSTLQVYLWLKAQGYELSKQVLISAAKNGNHALLEHFWKN